MPDFRKYRNISLIVSNGLSYNTHGHHVQIRNQLVNEQRNFCAYYEIYLRPYDSVDIEHYDPDLKNTANDSYENWYAIIHKFNMKKNKRKLSDYAPIPTNLILSTLNNEISYDITNHIFYSVNKRDDIENLIKYLLINDGLFIEDRKRSEKSLELLYNMLNDDCKFLKVITSKPENLNYYSIIKIKYPNLYISLQQDGLLP